MHRTFLKSFPLILSQAKRTENTFLHSDCAGLNITGQWVINICLKKKKGESSQCSSAFSLSCCKAGLRGSCSSLHHLFPPPLCGGMWRSEMIKEKQEKKRNRLVLFYYLFCLWNPDFFTVLVNRCIAQAKAQHIWMRGMGKGSWGMGKARIKLALLLRDAYSGTGLQRCRSTRQRPLMAILLKGVSNPLHNISFPPAHCSMLALWADTATYREHSKPQHSNHPG